MELGPRVPSRGGIQGSGVGQCQSEPKNIEQGISSVEVGPSSPDKSRFDPRNRNRYPGLHKRGREVETHKPLG